MPPSIHPQNNVLQPGTYVLALALICQANFRQPVARVLDNHPRLADTSVDRPKERIADRREMYKKSLYPVRWCGDK